MFSLSLTKYFFKGLSLCNQKHHNIILITIHLSGSAEMRQKKNTVAYLLAMVFRAEIAINPISFFASIFLPLSFVVQLYEREKIETESFFEPFFRKIAIFV